MKRVWQTLVLLWVFPGAFVAQNDFDILDGHLRKTVNFQYANNFILVEVKLFGTLPMSFIFDTGAEHTILFKKEFADVFHTRYDIRVPIVGSDQSREVYALVARGVDIELEGLDPVVRDILVLEEDFLTLDEITGRPIHGILGSSFFRNVVVHLDFKRQRIELLQPGKFNGPGRAYHEYDLIIRSGKPYLDTSIELRKGDSVDVRLLVDTGAGLPLLLHNNTDPSLELPEHYIRGKLGLGLGGYVEGHLGRISKLNLGVLDFNNIITSFQDLSEGVAMDSTRFRNGLIGTQLLMRFDVYIDYINEKLYLKTKGDYDKKFKFDKSGLIIFAMGHNLDVFVVQDIIANSPAEEVDIRPGDVIKSVKGIPTSFHSLTSLLRVFQRREGKKIRMTVQRKKQTLHKRFVLRELI